MQEKAYQVTIEGDVTGVGFRYSTQREASRHDGLKGYVRNKNARTVECFVQGPAEEVKEMLKWLREGPVSATVREVNAKEVSPREDARSFHIAF